MTYDQESKDLLRLAAHAMVSPLSSIINQTQLILHGVDGRINKEVRRDVEGIAHDASELKTRLDAAIVLLRLAGETPVLEPLVVSETIQGVIARIEWPEGIDHPIHVEVGKNVREMWADRNMLDVLLLTSLQLVGRAADEGPISLSASYGRGLVRFWIAPGDVTQTLVRAAFEEMPRRQLRGVSSIDLMLCQRVVEVHGGTLGACKRPGGEASGLCFSLPRDSRKRKT